MPGQCRPPVLYIHPVRHSLCWVVISEWTSITCGRCQPTLVTQAGKTAPRARVDHRVRGRFGWHGMKRRHIHGLDCLWTLCGRPRYSLLLRCIKPCQHAKLAQDTLVASSLACSAERKLVPYTRMPDVTQAWHPRGGCMLWTEEPVHPLNTRCARPPRNRCKRYLCSHLASTNLLHQRCHAADSAPALQPQSQSTKSLPRYPCRWRTCPKLGVIGCSASPASVKFGALPSRGGTQRSPRRLREMESASVASTQSPIPPCQPRTRSWTSCLTASGDLSGSSPSQSCVTNQYTDRESIGYRPARLPLPQTCIRTSAAVPVHATAGITAAGQGGSAAVAGRSDRQQASAVTCDRDIAVMLCSRALCGNTMHMRHSHCAPQRPRLDMAWE